MNTQNDTITRKQMADLSPMLTYGVVRHRERELGIYRCRITGFKCPILYRRSKLVLVLIKAGILQSA